MGRGLGDTGLRGRKGFREGKVDRCWNLCTGVNEVARDGPTMNVVEVDEKGKRAETEA